MLHDYLAGQSTNIIDFGSQTGTVKGQKKKPKKLICIFLVIFEDTECQGLCGENGTKSKRDHSHIMHALVGERGVKN